MRMPVLATLLALPLSAQAWDLRLEVPFPKGQSLPQTLVKGAVDTYAQGHLDTGNGYIASMNHRILRIGPILRFDWGLEVTRFKSDGNVDQGTSRFRSQLQQTGLGLSLQAQFSVPFTPIAGEVGLIQRVQNYRFEVAGQKQDQNLSRTWMRVGTRVNLPLPLPVVTPYLSASYQQPLSKDRPVRINSVSSLADLLAAQGSGQEFERLWTFGIGMTF